MAPSIIVDTRALALNARRLKSWGAGHGLGILPVLKAASGFGPALEALLAEGFSRFGLASAAEDKALRLPRQAKTLIQLTALGRANETAAFFGRSFQSSPEVLRALDAKAASLGLTHEIVLMVNLGDDREGLERGCVSDLLDLLLSLPSLDFRGFGATIACLGDKLPDKSLFDDLMALKSLAASRGLDNPVFSLGGSVMLAFVEAEGPGPITELRTGDPLLLGVDVYRQKELPGGPWRRDVARLEAEVVEISFRPGASYDGLRPRALVDMGRYHVGPVNMSEEVFPPFDGIECLYPGAAIIGATAGYLVLDLCGCPVLPKVGDTLAFRPGYWAMAQAFRNPEVAAVTQPKAAKQAAPELGDCSGRRPLPSESSEPSGIRDFQASS
jgi:predicted amino acid racemase